jgi:phosphonate transport system permease protein
VGKARLGACGVSVAYPLADRDPKHRFGLDAVGGGVACVLSLFATNGLAPWPRLVGVFRRITDVLRAIPELIIALMLIFVLGAGPVPAVIAIALHTAGALGKMFSEVAENADPKPMEGLASVGASWSQRMLLGVIPQVAPNWISYGLLRLEVNVRASAILGFVGAGGLGYDLKLAMQWGQGRYDDVVGIFALLFLAIMVIDQISDRIRHRLVKGAAL